MSVCRWGGVSVLAYGGVGLMTMPVRKPFFSPVVPWRFRPSCPSKIHSRTVTQCCCLKLLPITMDACWRHLWQPFVLFNYSVIHCLYLSLSLCLTLIVFSFAQGTVSARFHSLQLRELCTHIIYIFLCLSEWHWRPWEVLFFICLTIEYCNMSNVLMPVFHFDCLQSSRLSILQ